MGKLTLTTLLAASLVFNLSTTEAQAGRGRGFRPFGGLFIGVFRAVFRPRLFWGQRRGFYYSNGFPVGTYVAGPGGGWSGGSFGAPSCGMGGQIQPQQPQRPTPHDPQDPFVPKEPDLAHVMLHGLHKVPGVTLSISGKQFRKFNPEPEVRAFKSVKLEPGYTYTATFNVKYPTKDGGIATGVKTVDYRRGEVQHISLKDFKYTVAKAEVKPRNSATPPLPPIAPPATPPSERELTPPSKAPATLEWDLPREQVRIFLDGKEVPQGNQRIVTKALERGKRYFYDLKVEIFDEETGKFTDLEKVVSFRAGDHLVIGVGHQDPPQLLVATAPDVNAIAVNSRTAVER